MPKPRAPGHRFTVIALALALGAAALGLSYAQNRRARIAAALAEPFRGVATSDGVEMGLFPLRSTGVSTRPVVEAATRFLESLSEHERAASQYPVDDIEWRQWNNVHRAERQGIRFREMGADKRAAALELLRASLSAKGLEKTQNVMRLNEHIAEILGKHDEYGGDLYHLTLMGEPSLREPWGWQLEGHHLILNYFVLGDQVVLSPSFMGSEPVVGTGDYAGVEVLQDEQDLGLHFMQLLSQDQQAQAILPREKTRGDALAQAYNDNLVLDYEGLRLASLSAEQRDAAIALVDEYVGTLRPGHAKLRLEEVVARLDDTYFAWIGDVSDDSVFYYRLHSPVILIEFDHQGPIALDGPRVPSRRHVHSVVRTPNGNDYGKDLLRQHLLKHSDDPEHGHHHE